MSDSQHEPESTSIYDGLPARTLWFARGLLMGYYAIAFYGILTIMEGRGATAGVYVAAALCLLVARSRLLMVAWEDAARRRATPEVPDDSTSAGDGGEDGDTSSDHDASDNPSREHAGV